MDPHEDLDWTAGHLHGQPAWTASVGLIQISVMEFDGDPAFDEPTHWYDYQLLGDPLTWRSSADERAGGIATLEAAQRAGHAAAVAFVESLIFELGGVGAAWSHEERTCRSEVSYA